MLTSAGVSDPWVEGADVLPLPDITVVPQVPQEPLELLEPLEPLILQAGQDLVDLPKQGVQICASACRGRAGFNAKGIKIPAQALAQSVNWLSVLVTVISSNILWVRQVIRKLVVLEVTRISRFSL